MKKLSLLSILMATFSLLFTQSAMAACGEIVLGSAISLTGKYATNGIHAKNGYEHAIEKIKDAVQSFYKLYWIQCFHRSGDG